MPSLATMLEKLARPILRKTALAMFDELAESGWGDGAGAIRVTRDAFPRFVTALRDRARARLKGIV